jgi:SAM-dependent methyltransferase
MVALEAFLFKNRIKKLFNLDMRDEYDRIKNYLPDRASSILDIGCGVAGIDALLHEHYQNDNPKFFLFDKTELNEKVYYGIKKEAAFYNSLSVAKSLLENNGVPPQNIHLQEADLDRAIKFSEKFDLVISLISWGFHYPASTYLDRVYELLKPGGALIIDVRKGVGGEEEVRNKFHNAEAIYEAQKHIRIVAHKS